MDFRIGQQLSRLRGLPNPEDGLRAVVDKAPHAQAFVEGLVERYRPVWTWVYDSRRRLATAGLALLTLWLFLHVMFGANGMVVYRQKRAEYQSLSKETDDMQKENDRYARQIKALETDPKTIEKEAREQLHYARPGEVIYVAPAPFRPQKPSTNAARR
jgi:cell division protein FtsB